MIIASPAYLIGYNTKLYSTGHQYKCRYSQVWFCSQGLLRNPLQGYEGHQDHHEQWQNDFPSIESTSGSVSQTGLAAYTLLQLLVSKRQKREQN